MSLTYRNLWHTLIDKGMSKSDLRRATGISSVTLAKLSKGEPIGTMTLEKICKTLNCHVSDVVDYVPDADVPQRESMA